MARFDVYENPYGPGALLDVQADLLDALNTCVVVPLIPLDQAPPPLKGLNPVFEIGGMRHVMTTQFLSAVPRSLLDEPIVNVIAHDTEITNALDMLLTGI